MGYIHKFVCAPLCYCCVCCNGCTQNSIISCNSVQDIVMWPHSIPMTSYRASEWAVSERRVMLTAHHMNLSHALTSNGPRSALMSSLFLAAQKEALCTGWLSDRRPQWKTDSIECGGLPSSRKIRHREGWWGRVRDDYSILSCCLREPTGVWLQMTPHKTANRRLKPG